ncbi:hypothetical protein F5884DRAFT_901449 [Xylogone sp. PMI_703]|nr:hypothetical protein F5884DRAFT_901449 [Xylogone sp. PMI_703]
MTVENSEARVYHLSEEQKQFWLEHGYVKVPNCFSREAADDFTSTIWTRLGASPEDKSTWPVNRLNMPGHVTISAKEFAPKAWDAVCELLGGEDKIDDWCVNWKDGFIVNLGDANNVDYESDYKVDFRALDNWHADGDWFFHFLDSPEQALLIIPLFTDIEPNGGGTVVCTDGIRLVAQRLYDHPEGLTPFLALRDAEAARDPFKRVFWNEWAQDRNLTRDESFHEITGKKGDVFLLHPFMLHSASKNLLRRPRIITNPPVMLKKPFNYSRVDPVEYSLVEQKTLRELGRPEGLPEWKITGPRERIVPTRVQVQANIKKLEIQRLVEAGVSPNKLTATPLIDGDYPS